MYIYGQQSSASKTHGPWCRMAIKKCKIPVSGDKRSRMLEGIVVVRNGPATVVVIMETRSMPLSYANWNAAFSVKSFESTYTCRIQYRALTNCKMIIRYDQSRICMRGIN